MMALFIEKTNKIFLIVCFKKKRFVMKPIEINRLQEYNTPALLMKNFETGSVYESCSALFKYH